MSSLQQHNVVHAVHLNNLAVQLINNGRTEEATDLLAKALKCNEQYLSSSSSSNTCSSSRRHHVSTIILDDCMKINDEATTITTGKSGGDHHQAGDYSTTSRSISHLFVYSRAIKVPIDLILRTVIGYESAYLLTIVIIFNLALAYHIASEDAVSPTKRTRDLNKALKLYANAYNLETDNHKYFDATTTTTGRKNTIFEMATINNMATIYQSLEQTKAADTMFEKLLSTILLSLTGERGQQQLGEMIISDQYLNGFFGNVLPRVMSKRSVAPAA